MTTKKKKIPFFDIYIGRVIKYQKKFGRKDGEKNNTKKIKITQKLNSLEKDIIVISPHYINSLKYFDKLYDCLISENIEIIYFFPNNKEMEKYCKENHRNYEIIGFEYFTKFLLAFEPYFRFKLKKELEGFFKRVKPKLIILYNDVNVFNNIIVRVAHRFKRTVLILQWAVTAPEELYFMNRKRKLLNSLGEKSRFQLAIKDVNGKLSRMITFPISHLLGVYQNHKQSFGQGDSDFIGVINKFTKDLLIRQGVNKNKIKVVGSLHYDDALNVRNKSLNEIKRKYDVEKSKVLIVFFSQPFYVKDITILSLGEQLSYTEDLIKNIDNFYKDINIDYKLIIKLHPAENLKDYKNLLKYKNIKLNIDADNYELIHISNLCISQHSTVLQLALILKKPVISLNILGFQGIKIGSNIIGIKNCITSWKEFVQTLNILEDNNYSSLNNVEYDRVISDGACYSRIVNLIKSIVNRKKSM